MVLIAATDVDHPMLGPSGAARVFGPQKAPTPTPWSCSSDGWPSGPRNLMTRPNTRSVPGPSAGAAGGLGAALLALGARRESGAAVVARHTGLTGDVARADLLITGEGRFDDQSLHGKVVSSLTAAARHTGIPVLVLAGQVALDPAALSRAGITAAHPLADHAGSVRLAISDAANQLTGLARRTAAGLSLTRE